MRDALGPGTRLARGVRGPARPRHRRLRHRLSGARPRAAARHRHQGVHAGGAGAARRRGHGGAARSAPTAAPRHSAKGLESFLGEARLLASFDHPALVKVHRFWRSNATAYMAMPYYPGRTLKDVRLEMTAAPGEAWLMGLIEPVLGALEQLHAHGVYHRDVAPDNILVLPDGRPVLLDFGCARRAVAGGSQWFTAHLKPQFAPLEQYADEGSVGQGPWTDLYSLGATLHFVVTGRAPPPRWRAPCATRCRRFRPCRCRGLRPACWPPSTGPSPSRPAIGRRTSRRFDVPSAARSRRRRRGGCRSRPATRVPPRRPLRRRAMAPKREDCRAKVCRSRRGEPIVACTGARRCRSRSPRWSRSGWGPWDTDRGLAGGAPPSVAAPAVGHVAKERVSFPSDWRTPCLRSFVVPAVADAPRGEAVEPSVASVRADLGARPVAVADKPLGRRVPRRRARQNGPCRPPPATSRAPAVATVARLLTRALCVLNPCRDPGGRNRAECLDRQRAEEARLRRMASLG